MTIKNIVRFNVQDTHRIVIGFSEAAMHLQRCGQRLPVKLLDNETAQIYDDHGAPVSFPILASEAGIYRDQLGHYGYE